MTVEDGLSTNAFALDAPATVTSGIPPAPVKPPRPGLVSATAMAVVPVTAPPTCSMSAVDPAPPRYALTPSTLPAPPLKAPDTVTLSVLALPVTAWRMSSAPPALLNAASPLNATLPETWTRPVFVMTFAAPLLSVNDALSVEAVPSVSVPSLDKVSVPAPAKVKAQPAAQSVTVNVPPSLLSNASAAGPKLLAPVMLHWPALLIVLAPVVCARWMPPAIVPLLFRSTLP